MFDEIQRTCGSTRAEYFEKGRHRHLKGSATQRGRGCCTVKVTKFGLCLLPQLSIISCEIAQTNKQVTTGWEVNVYFHSLMPQPTENSRGLEKFEVHESWESWFCEGLLHSYSLREVIYSVPQKPDSNKNIVVVLKVVKRQSSLLIKISSHLIAIINIVMIPSYVDYCYFLHSATTLLFNKIIF